jgi:hypothetical protein
MVLVAPSPERITHDADRETASLSQTYADPELQWPSAMSRFGHFRREHFASKTGNANDSVLQLSLVQVPKVVSQVAYH